MNAKVLLTTIWGERLMLIENLDNNQKSVINITDERYQDLISKGFEEVDIS